MVANIERCLRGICRIRVAIITVSGNGSNRPVKTTKNNATQARQVRTNFGKH